MLENISSKYKPKKYAGVLLHPTSLPGPYGIGELGKEAYDFIDFLVRSGLNTWQVLPMGHTGFGDSPYQPFSAFAGQPLVISLDHLKALGLLNDSDFFNMPACASFTHMVVCYCFCDIFIFQLVHCFGKILGVHTNTSLSAKYSFIF